ncbi:MAG: hypothetical protein JKY65_03845 [Planctomycetes bacterium]|nr:hypothetical protein [Planctomycetota bacterium]
MTAPTRPLVATLVRIRSRAEPTHCPLCRDSLSSGAEGRCGSCDTHYHQSCFAEFGGCSTLGCSAYRQPMRESRARADSRIAPVSACSVCWAEDAPTELCPCACGVVLHAHCREQEGCGTTGCVHERARRSQPRPRPSGWRRPEVEEGVSYRVLGWALLVAFLTVSFMFLPSEVQGLVAAMTGLFAWEVLGRSEP